MPRLRIVHAFSAGGVVFRVTTLTALTTLTTLTTLAYPPGIDSLSDSPADIPGDAPGVGAMPARAPALDGVEVVLVGFLRDDTWTLPKGTPTVGESVEETALREVREETGIQARIVGDLGSIQYSFARRGVRFNKEVRHFLMEATGGDVTLHDAEYDEARWFALADAMQRLTYVNEAEVVRRARPLIGKHLTDGGA